MLWCRAEVFYSKTSWRRRNIETAIEFASYPTKKLASDTPTPEADRNPRRMYQISSSSVTLTWELAHLEEVRGKPSTAAPPPPPDHLICLLVTSLQLLSCLSSISPPDWMTTAPLVSLSAPIVHNSGFVGRPEMERDMQWCWLSGIRLDNILRLSHWTNRS